MYATMATNTNTKATSADNILDRRFIDDIDDKKNDDKWVLITCTTTNTNTTSGFHSNADNILDDWVIVDVDDKKNDDEWVLIQQHTVANAVVLSSGNIIENYFAAAMCLTPKK